MIQLLAHIGVEQRLIALTPPPEHVVFATQLMGRVHAGFHRRSGKGKDIGIRVG